MMTKGTVLLVGDELGSARAALTLIAAGLTATPGRPAGSAGASPAGSAGAAAPAVNGSDAGGPGGRLLAALVALRQLRAHLDEWEPQLVAAARDAGVSWAELAPALGVASRQAAERRYLRRRRSEHDDTGTTREHRVQAERKRRAGQRAVADWARSHGADLRQLAGQVSALTDLGRDAQVTLDRLHEALGGTDAATLLPLLADTQEHLPSHHAALADRISAIADRTDEVRRTAQAGSNATQT